MSANNLLTDSGPGKGHASRGVRGEKAVDHPRDAKNLEKA